MTLVIERLKAVRGCGVSSGRWEFEELCLADSVWGRATIRYEPRCVRRHGDLIMDIEAPIVIDAVIFDDDGNTIELDDESQRVLNNYVLDAFRGVEGDVIEFEMGLL